MLPQDEPKHSNFDRKTSRRYHRELGASLAVYAVLLVCSIRYGRAMDEGVLKVAALLSPMVGFLLALWAITRQLRRMDEYVRMVLLENIAGAAALTAGLSFTYGFLETAGYPRLSMFAVWMVLCGSFGLTAIVRSWTRR